MFICSICYLLSYIVYSISFFLRFVAFIFYLLVFSVLRFCVVFVLWRFLMRRAVDGADYRRFILCHWSIIYLLSVLLFIYLLVVDFFASFYYFSLFLLASPFWIEFRRAVDGWGDGYILYFIGCVSIHLFLLFIHLPISALLFVLSLARPFWIEFRRAVDGWDDGHVGLASASR